MTSRIKTLYDIFSYLRVDNFNKGRACEKIRELLCNSGYDLHISDEGNHNIETLCDDPEFIIMTRYNSLFKYDADSSTSGLVASVILSESLSNYRKKIKFIFFDDKEDIVSVLKKYEKNVKIINLDCVGRGEDILISDNNERNNTFKSDFINYLNSKGIEYSTEQFLDSSYSNFDVEDLKMITIRRVNIIKKENRSELVSSWINSTDDTVDKIDYKKINEIVELLKHYINNKIW